MTALERTRREKAWRDALPGKVRVLSDRRPRCLDRWAGVQTSKVIEVITNQAREASYFK